jgi:Pentapeptide repeats (8 copies)
MTTYQILAGRSRPAKIVRTFCYALMACLRRVFYGMKESVEKAVLARVDLTGADLAGVDLTGANLRGARLARADLTRANLRGANLEQANLELAKLRRANLRGANLTGVNLTGADLTEADLRGAVIIHSNLRSVDFTGANLTGADITGADLSGASLVRANLAETAIIDGGQDARGFRFVAWQRRDHAVYAAVGYTCDSIESALAYIGEGYGSPDECIDRLLLLHRGAIRRGWLGRDPNSDDHTGA